MSCQHDQDLLLLYAADALEDDDKAVVESWIIVCDDCDVAVEQARQTWAAIGLTQPPRSASGEVKRWLLDATNDPRGPNPRAPSVRSSRMVRLVAESVSDHFHETSHGVASNASYSREAADEPEPVTAAEAGGSAVPPRKTPRWRYALAAAAGIVLGIGSTFLFFNHELGEVGQIKSQLAQMQKRQADQSLGDQLLSWIDSPAVQVVSLDSPGKQSKSWGRLMWNAERRVAYFFADQLPRPTPDKGAYSLFVITESGKRIRVNDFTLDDEHRAKFKFSPPEGGESIRSIQIAHVELGQGKADNSRDRPLLAGGWPE